MGKLLWEHLFSVLLFFNYVVSFVNVTQIFVNLVTRRSPLAGHIRYIYWHLQALDGITFSHLPIPLLSVLSANALPNWMYVFLLSLDLQVTWLETDLFTLGLGFLMLSMGLTLTFEDFRRCLRNPWTVFFCPLTACTRSTHRFLYFIPPEIM